jgi:microcystin-dependent protein
MAELPVGTIVLFSGKTIPSGWLLCDGRNDTPDLTNRFILGASSLDDTGKINKTIMSNGGDGLFFTAPSTSVSVRTKGNVDSHNLTEKEIPSHHHTGGFALQNDGFSVFGGKFDSSHSEKWSHFSGHGNTNNYLAYTDNVGGGQGHAHSLDVTSEVHAHETKISPPYYVMAFIIYKGQGLMSK